MMAERARTFHETNVERVACATDCLAANGHLGRRTLFVSAKVVRSAHKAQLASEMKC